MTDDELRKEGYKYLDWMNGWDKAPKELVKCRSLGHKKKKKSYSNRGSNHTVYCDECKIFFKYDSSG